MLLDDLVEGGEHGGNGVVRGADVPLRVTARQLLHQVPHSVLSYNPHVPVSFSSFFFANCSIFEVG